MVGDAQNQMNTELIAWVDSIPFSKPTKNLTKDFSDAVLVAEILKLYYPRYVELHNYIPVNNLNMKIENWNTLNRKVLVKIDMKLNKKTIYHLASGSQGTIEKLLLELRAKILKDDEKLHKERLMKHNIESTEAQLSKEKIIVNLPHNGQPNLLEENSKAKTNNEIYQSNLTPKVGCFRRGISTVFHWITSLFFWNIFSFCRLFYFGKHPRNVFVDIAIQQRKNDETVPLAIYEKMKRELREKEEIIRTLNHKIAYLESSMKLKDLRISSLTAQILQNAVETNCPTMKLQPNDGVQIKLRSRSHNFYETKAN
ncbi:sperm flagellar protein 1 [Harpegnathos saltator]|uniref:sperm flagellar protein 1 n=1 Tax=Harpegnathos saltator TaxID=610380 RepID=UPI0009491545|nr:sperm flagellar protein 1 [Harpegnathos saltator]